MSDSFADRFIAAKSAGIPNPWFAAMDDAERAKQRVLMEIHSVHGWRRMRPEDQDDILHGRCIWLPGSEKTDYHAILDYGGVLKR